MSPASAEAILVVPEDGLRVEDASVVLGDKKILDGVSFNTSRGTWLGVVGPNGAGKTTLLRSIAGLCPLSQGRIEVFGTEFTKVRTARRALTVAYVPQDPLIPGGISVADYVLLGRNPHISSFGVESRHDLDVVGEVVHRLELEGFADRDLATLSGGERQRVVLARALAQEAPALLLDEPTGGLDLGHAQEVLELVDQLRLESGITVVSAIHDLTLASQYAESLLMLDHGSIVASGAAPDVLTEERLARHYRATVHIRRGVGSDVVVAPRRLR